LGRGAYGRGKRHCRGDPLELMQWLSHIDV
jgi:hypothetical protein